MKEKGSRKLISGMDGAFSLRGDNLVIYTMDLDKVLSSYETSQEFNLVDLGAFFVAGLSAPLRSRAIVIGTFIPDPEGGRHHTVHLSLEDQRRCGRRYGLRLATHHNRVALKGKLNLVSEQYDNVIVALLDDKGCAKFKQGVSVPSAVPGSTR